MARDLPFDQHTVVRLLDELLPGAATPQNIGVSFDVRLYFRENPDGSEWAEVTFIDRSTGKLIHTGDRTFPLSGPDVVSWFFGEMGARGFPRAVEMRSAHAVPDATPSVDSACQVSFLEPQRPALIRRSRI